MNLEFLGLSPDATDEEVWAALEDIPGFIEGVEAGQADVEAGRLYDGRLHSNYPSRPMPSWRPDDETQPPGWFHDGTRWRLRRDGGWWIDPFGFWRYNAPGDIGWVQERPGDPECGWEYIEGDGSA